MRHHNHPPRPTPISLLAIEPTKVVGDVYKLKIPVPLLAERSKKLHNHSPYGESSYKSSEVNQRRDFSSGGRVRIQCVSLDGD